MKNTLSYALILLGLVEIVGAGGLANGLQRAWKAWRTTFSALETLQAAGLRMLISLIVAGIPFFAVMSTKDSHYVLPLAIVAAVTFASFLLFVQPMAYDLDVETKATMAVGVLMLVAGISLGILLFRDGNPIAAFLVGGLLLVLSAQALGSKLYGLIRGTDD